MAKEYVPIFYDWLEVTQDLSAEEKGNLIDAAVAYASGLEYEHYLEGYVKVAFRFIKGQIDRNNAISEKRSEAGSKKPTETNDNKTEQNVTNYNKTNQTESKLPKENENKKEKEKENDTENKNEYEPLVADGDAMKIAREHDQVINAAETAGFPRTDAVRGKLIDLYSEHGMKKMLAAIDACVEQGKTSIAYLRGVLRGTPKKGPPTNTKTVVAQQYDQRDYTGVTEELMSEQDREMAEYMAKERDIALSG